MDFKNISAFNFIIKLYFKSLLVCTLMILSFILFNYWHYFFLLLYTACTAKKLLKFLGIYIYPWILFFSVSQDLSQCLCLPTLGNLSYIFELRRVFCRRTPEVFSLDDRKRKKKEMEHSWTFPRIQRKMKHQPIRLMMYFKF